MTLVKLINQSYGWDGVIWERGSVLEVDDYVATYQIACKRMEAAEKGAKLTPKPEPMMVTPKATPQATGEAIAEALANKLGGGKARGKAHDAEAEAEEDEDDKHKSSKAKKHEF